MVLTQQGTMSSGKNPSTAARWGYRDDHNCDCGEIQTMNHPLTTCPLGPHCSNPDLRELTKIALNWLCHWSHEIWWWVCAYMPRCPTAVFPANFYSALALTLYLPVAHDHTVLRYPSLHNWYSIFVELVNIFIAITRCLGIHLDCLKIVSFIQFICSTLYVTTRSLPLRKSTKLYSSHMDLKSSWCSCLPPSGFTLQ